VKLPLVEERFSAGVMLRLVALLLLGFLLQLLVAALVATRFPALEETDPEDGRRAAQSGASDPDTPSEPLTAARKLEPYPRPNRPFKRRWLPAYAVVMLGSAALSHAWPQTAQTAFLVCTTLLVLVAANSLPPGVRKVAHPIVVSLFGSWLGAAVWAALRGPSVSFQDVLEGYSTNAGVLLSMFLAPLVIALALLLFERRQLLQQDLVPILATSSSASISGLFGTALLARALGLPRVLSVASISRFVTAPLAVVIAGVSGASTTFALAIVMVTGLLGALFALPLCERLPGLRGGGSGAARARGLAVGASGHVLGTMALAGAGDARAFPYGAVCFVLIGSMSVACMSVPILRDALLSVIGSS